MNKVKLPLPELIETVKTRMRELKYSSSTIYGYSCHWRKLCRYADERRSQYFSAALGEDFLREVYHLDMTAEKQTSELPRWKINSLRRAVYLLAEFQNSGSVLRKMKGDRTPVPTCFKEMTERFYAMCRSRYNGERTMQSKKFTVERFLLHLDQKGVREIKVYQKQFFKIRSKGSPWKGWTSAQCVAAGICAENAGFH